MDKQDKNLKEINIDKLYPDLEEIYYNQEESEFIAQVKGGKWQHQNVYASNPYELGSGQQQKQDQGFNNNIQSVPVNEMKYHVIRSHKSWQQLMKDTLNWVNKNIHPLRIVSISVVLCHSTAAGQCTIFYNDAKDQYMKRKIAPLVNYYLSAAIVNTGKTWDSHHKDVMKTAAELGASGGLVSISQLQTNMTHNRATTVIWFLQRK